MTCCEWDDEFGIRTCADPDHCEHPSMNGVGDMWGCDICGHREPKSGPAGGEPAGPGGPSAPTAAGPETSGPPSGAAASPGLARVGAGRDIDHQ